MSRKAPSGPARKAGAQGRFIHPELPNWEKLVTVLGRWRLGKELVVVMWKPLLISAQC